MPSDELEYKDKLPPGAASAFNSLLLALDWLYKPPTGKHDAFWLSTSLMCTPYKILRWEKDLYSILFERKKENWQTAITWTATYEGFQSTENQFGGH